MTFLSCFTNSSLIGQQFWLHGFFFASSCSCVKMFLHQVINVLGLYGIPPIPLSHFLSVSEPFPMCCSWHAEKQALLTSNLHSDKLTLLVLNKCLPYFQSQHEWAWFPEMCCAQDDAGSPYTSFFTWLFFYQFILIFCLAFKSSSSAAFVGQTEWTMDCLRWVH